MNLKRIQFFLTWFKIPILLISINFKWLIVMIGYNKLAYCLFLVGIYNIFLFIDIEYVIYMTKSCYFFKISLSLSIYIISLFIYVYICLSYFFRSFSFSLLSLSLSLSSIPFFSISFFLSPSFSLPLSISLFLSSSFYLPLSLFLFLSFFYKQYVSNFVMNIFGIVDLKKSLCWKYRYLYLNCLCMKQTNIIKLK